MPYRPLPTGKNHSETCPQLATGATTEAGFSFYVHGVWERFELPTFWLGIDNEFIEDPLIFASREWLTGFRRLQKTLHRHHWSSRLAPTRSDLA